VRGRPVRAIQKPYLIRSQTTSYYVIYFWDTTLASLSNLCIIRLLRIWALNARIKEKNFDLTRRQA
jgi:hypothetical protein